MRAMVLKTLRQLNKLLAAPISQRDVRDSKPPDEGYELADRTYEETEKQRKAQQRIEKLQRIRQLWVELGRAKASAPEYKKVLKNIRALSAEYQAIIVDAPKKPKKLK